VILPNHLGDAVMATPSLRALRRGFPDAEIVGTIRREIAPILRGGAWFDRLVEHDVYTTRSALRRLRRRLSLGRALRGSDAVVVFPNSVSSALLAMATGAPRRVGYNRGNRGWLLTEPLDPPRENGRVVPRAMERYYLDLVARLGCPEAGTTLELHTEPDAEKACNGLFERHGLRGDAPLVCVAPGAGFGPSKLWPAEYFGRVAAALRKEGARVALVHGPGEEKLAMRVAEHAGGGLASLGGEGMGLSLLKSILARSQLLICNDAGARHISAAFGVPTIVLMGPTSLRYTNLNLARTRILREPVECSPCHLKVCPIDHRCMRWLRPERVLSEARSALRDPEWTGDVHLELQ
jgi:heptosyltransferase-2